MTNYTKSTNFASKDSLSTGNALKIVKGTEIDTEFNNIATAVATKADIVSPTFTGTPAAPTASTGTSTTQVATTAFVANAVAVEDAVVALKAPLASPTFTGTPAAPTAAIDTSTTQLATTAYVLAQAASVTPAAVSTAAVGTSTRFARADHAHAVADGAVTAAKLSGAQTGTAPIFGTRAWVVFDGTNTVGTNCTIAGSGNITSVYKNAAGDFTVTFATALPSATYAISGAALDTASSGGTSVWYSSSTSATTSACRVYFYNSVYSGVAVAKMCLSFIC